MKRILHYGPILQAELRNFIETKQSTTNKRPPWRADFLERLQPFATNGKLLRGSVVCFSYSMFDNKDLPTAVIKAAMAIELAHSALLIHDDIMDKDSTRRGLPSMHQQYKSLNTWQETAASNHFGLSMAICGGDAALFLAFELLATAELNPKVAIHTNELFTKHFALTCAGQMQDVYFEATPEMPSKQAIYELMRTKTASYTLALPLGMGAALAGQPASTIQQLEDVGLAAGTIFQIRDDELGAIGNAANLGKPIGSDIKEGKKTLLYYYLLKLCTQHDRKQLKAIFGNPEATDQDINYVQAMIKRYDISASLNREVDTLTKRAIKKIEKLRVSPDAKADLTELVAFCASRQK